MRHPEAELIAFLHDELSPPDRERLGAHLRACDDCGARLEDFRAVMHRLAETPPAPPSVQWARYGAELRTRLERRPPARRWWARPVPLAVSAGLAGVLLVLAILGGLRPLDRREPLTAFEETVIGDRLDLLRQYSLLERLELLEDLDILRQLDRLPATREG